MIVKTALLISIAAATAAAATVRADDPLGADHFIHKWSDVQLYLKPKYNFVNSWDQEFGIQGTLYKYGNFAEGFNVAYDPTYMIRFDQKPRFALGFQSTYYFTKLPLKMGIYTKPKMSLPYALKDETGFTWRLYTSPHFIVSSNAAFVFNYPHVKGTKPQWLGLVNFQFPLG